MFWIALELSVPKIGLNIMLSLTVKKLDAFKFDGVAESDNTSFRLPSVRSSPLCIDIGVRIELTFKYCILDLVLHFASTLFFLYCHVFERYKGIG